MNEECQGTGDVKMREHVVRCVKCVFGLFCYYGGVDALFYWLNRSAKRVVTIHNVVPDSVCQGGGKMPMTVRESVFRRLLSEICKHFVVDVDLAARGTLTITFDDGYLNQCEVAGRVLGDYGAPAVLFVVDDVFKAKGRDSALAPDRRNHENLHFTSEYERLRLSGVSLDNLKTLRDRGWRIGYHTKTHRRLSQLSRAEKTVELRPPEWLRDLGGEQMIISYPFGQSKDVDLESEKLTKEFGYARAYSNQCEDDGRISGYFLPRIPLSQNKYWLHLELSGAKYFFKYRKLLPSHEKYAV